MNFWQVSPDESNTGDPQILPWEKQKGSYHNKLDLIGFSKQACEIKIYQQKIWGSMRSPYLDPLVPGSHTMPLHVILPYLQSPFLLLCVMKPFLSFMAQPWLGRTHHLLACRALALLSDGLMSITLQMSDSTLSVPPQTQFLHGKLHLRSSLPFPVPRR